MDKFMRSLGKLEAAKRLMENREKMGNETTKHHVAVKMTIEEELYQLKMDRIASEKMMKQMELGSSETCNEEEIWRDMRAGTQDELNVDTDAYKELQKEYDEDQKRASTQIQADSKHAGDMQQFYNPAQCTERLPVLETTIVSKQKKQDEWAKQSDTLQTKLGQLAFKKEIQRGKQNHFPNDTLKHFVTGEGKKYRQMLAKKFMRYRLEIRQDDDMDMD